MRTSKWRAISLCLIEYKGRRIRGKLRLDLLVGGCIIVELKAVETIHPIYLAQVITYLKLSGCPAGLLMNFNTASLRNGLRRFDHPYFYNEKRCESLYRWASVNRRSAIDPAF